jgi:hypothetical protein
MGRWQVELEEGGAQQRQDNVGKKGSQKEGRRGRDVPIV